MPRNTTVSHIILLAQVIKTQVFTSLTSTGTSINSSFPSEARYELFSSLIVCSEGLENKSKMGTMDSNVEFDEVMIIP